MSRVPDITLEVRAGAAGPGWTEVTASNNQPYSFRYTGGSDGAGAMSEDTDDIPDSVNLRLVGPTQFQLYMCTFEGDVHQQLSFDIPASRQMVIHDRDSEPQEASYAVIVLDTANDDCTIRCDPPVVNRPKGTGT